MRISRRDALKTTLAAAAATLPLPYYARAHSPWPIPQGARIAAPTGYAQFPKEILRPPRSVAERTYANIQRWTEMKKGGHFAALEQPEALAQEIREFFRPLR